MKRQVWVRRLAPLFLLCGFLLTSCGGGLPAVSWFGVAVQDQVVYLAANQQVFALNLDSGAELWSFPPKADNKIGPFYATPLLIDETLLVGSYNFQDGKFYALSPESGTETWAIETESAFIAGAVPVEGGVVVGNGEGEVFIIETQTQDRRTLLKAKEPIWARPLVDEAGGRVYVASMDHHLYAVDLESGEQLWRFDAEGALAGTPALSDGLLYFGAIGGRFYAVDAETGTKRWDLKTEGWVWGGPLVDRGTVYFGDMAGKLYALDAATGNELWPAFEAEGGVRATPVLTDGVLYFGTRGKMVYAVRAENGVQEWALPLTGSVYSQPVVRGEYLLVSPHNAKAKLVALNKESGAELWSYPREEE